MNDSNFIRTTPTRDGIGGVTICAPLQRNALNREILDGLVDAIESIASDETCRVVILRAEGDHFCAGWDVKDFGRLSAMTPEQIAQELQSSIVSLQRIRSAPAVILGAVRGTVAGAGVGLLRALHLSVAADNVKIVLPEIGFGIIPAGVMVDLLDLPATAALDLLLTGEPIDARRALELGLIGRTVSAASLDGEVDRLANLVASHPAHTVRSLLETFIAVAPKPLESSYLRACQESAKSVAALGESGERA